MFNQEDNKKQVYREIDLGLGNKLIFFRNIDFWNTILPKSVKESEFLDIVTYNFNFEEQSGNTMYNRLLSLADKGISIRLFYSSKVSKDSLIDHFFDSEILAVRFPMNHSKICLSTKCAFIGSANFSHGSENNFECGFLTENKDVIDRIRTEIINSLIWKNQLEIITLPEIFDPLELTRQICKDISAILKEFNDNGTISDYFDYSWLRVLYKELRKTDLPIEYDELIQFEEESNHLFSKMMYGDEFTHNEMLEIRDLLTTILSYVENIKEWICVFYEKHGKYNVTH